MLESIAGHYHVDSSACAKPGCRHHEVIKRGLLTVLWQYLRPLLTMQCSSVK